MMRGNCRFHGTHVLRRALLRGLQKIEISPLGSKLSGKSESLPDLEADLRSGSDLFTDQGVLKIKKALEIPESKDHLLDHDTVRLGREITQHKVPEIFIVVVVMALNMNEFKKKKDSFLREIVHSLKKSRASCYILRIKKISTSKGSVDIYCQYRLASKQHTGSGSEPLVFVPVHDLELSLSSGQMRGFLQNYNVTQFFRRTKSVAMETSYEVTEEVWFPAAVAAGSSCLLVVVIIFIVCCCRSPCVGNNSSKAEQLESVKGTFVCHPVKPIETMSPRMVQPEMGTLWKCSAGEPRTKTLLQSRRGSQASLILDLSPIPKDTGLENSRETSPTEELLLMKTKQLTYQELKVRKDEDKILYEEFWYIPPNTLSRRSKKTQYNASLKNRYADFVPNPKSAVKLKEINDDPQSSYINANFIKGHSDTANAFIATEGPLQSTVKDFWRMIWEHQCPVIVMITKLKEKNEEKCAEYWPSPRTKRQQDYGDVTVTYDSDITRQGYLITTLYISHKKSLEPARLVTHYWFTSWPDHKVPKSSQEIISLAREVRNARKSQAGPVVVHCSAGRGRTGCFIAISNGMQQIDEFNCVDVLRIVSNLRIDRGGMVGKDEQYIFIHRALYDYWRGLRAYSPTFSASSTLDIEQAEEAREDIHENQGRYFQW